jgi:hypothetical protein
LCAKHYFAQKKPEWREQRGGREIERARWLRTTFGLTLEQYDEILEAQGGVCAICGAPPGEKNLGVDHDHACCPSSRKTCGKCIRGLLCMNCNQELGFMEKFRSNPLWVEKADAYLARIG